VEFEERRNACSQLFARPAHVVTPVTGIDRSGPGWSNRRRMSSAVARGILRLLDVPNVGDPSV